jgi:hypothetical protein
VGRVEPVEELFADDGGGLPWWWEVEYRSEGEDRADDAMLYTERQLGIARRTHVRPEAARRGDVQ